MAVKKGSRFKEHLSDSKACDLFSVLERGNNQVCHKLKGLRGLMLGYFFLESGYQPELWLRQRQHQSSASTAPLQELRSHTQVQHDTSLTPTPIHSVQLFIYGLIISQHASVNLKTEIGVLFFSSVCVCSYVCKYMFVLVCQYGSQRTILSTLSQKSSIFYFETGFLIGLGLVG